MFHLHSTTWRRKPYRTPTNATHTIRCIVMTCIGPLSAPKSRGNGSGHSRTVSVHVAVPKATARVSIRFRRAERAQTKRHRTQPGMRKTEAGTHVLFPSAPTSRKPPPASVFVFGALSAPKPELGKWKRALTHCFRPHRHPESHRPRQYSISALRARPNKTPPAKLHKQ